MRVGARRDSGWWFMRSISGISVKFPKARDRITEYDLACGKVKKVWGVCSKVSWHQRVVSQGP